LSRNSAKIRECFGLFCLTENARLASFFGRFGRNKVAYQAQGTIYNKNPIDTMPLSVLVYELEGPRIFGNR
jgi:hypothetical protein